MANYIHVPACAPAVPKLDITVDDKDISAGAMKLIKELRPNWDPSEVKMKLFTDGITNKLIGCYVGKGMEDVVLVRIYGNKTELFVDRKNEVKSFRVLHAHNCAPPLYCTFNNGLCYQFMHGTALDPEDIRQPELFRLIARQLAKFHAIHAHNGWVPKSNLWMKMGKYFSLAPTEFEDKAVNHSVNGCEWFREQSDNGNVKFIDYEYAGYNYQGFDIGNHFNEFAGINEVDYSRYPSKELQMQWLKAYLESYKEYKGQGSQVSEKEVEVLYVQVNQFALASHFFWGLWALIQAKYSTIDFDFLGYAIVRFNQYIKMKPEVTALNFP
ncbi:Ethanolamine kinase 1 [Acipenser ruthenus]|uniref:ethanolamine kinase n=1 Tax=Acipenser ruthenus TaxID=7906 RepID=A0A662YKH4_ACIRT|nr:Ethanolamine kinase 1 [Acipenser ruthenus]